MEQSSILSKAYNCDCLEYMRKLPDNYFDLAIADPPYGIGASRPSKKAERARQPDGSILKVPVTDFTKKDWDDAIPTQEFFDELRRVSRNQIVWGANYFGLQGGMIVWDKVNGNSDQYDCEIAYQSFNKRTDLVHYMWNGMFQGKYCGRDIRQAAVQQGNKTLNEKRIHPTQKPVILYEWLLNNYAKKGDRIFDPMMGSQSSRIAAYRLGFDYIGCELDKEYFEKGCARFNSEQMGNNKSITNNKDIMDKNSFIDAEQQLLNFLRENFPGRDDIVHLTNPISFIDAEGKPYEVTGIELPTDDTETYSVQMQDARNREAGDYDYMELHSFGNFEKLLTGLQSNHEHKLSTSEMQVIEGHFARLRGALASIDVTNNLLAHELKGIVIDDNVHNVDHIRSYSRRLLFIINKENMELRCQQWNDLEKLSSGSLRQAVYAMAYSMSDAQIRSMTFGKILDDNKALLDKHIASKELADAKARLVKVLESARADFGDTILIQPTTVSLAGIDTTIKAIFLAPDCKGGGEFRLAGEDYAVLAVGNGGHTEFEVGKILDTEDSVNALANAVHEAHVTQLKQGAKQAIHDRITNSWQRFFTSDQVNALNRYHQVVTPDIPAHQEFRYLLDEVAQESDVARKPEKWVNDTARELDGLAEGITRESGQGLKR